LRGKKHLFQPQAEIGQFKSEEKKKQKLPVTVVFLMVLFSKKNPNHLNN